MLIDPIPLVHFCMRRPGMAANTTLFWYIARFPFHSTLRVSRWLAPLLDVQFPERGAGVAAAGGGAEGRAAAGRRRAQRGTPTAPASRGKRGGRRGYGGNKEEAGVPGEERRGEQPVDPVHPNLGICLSEPAARLVVYKLVQVGETTWPSGILRCRSLMLTHRISQKSCHKLGSTQVQNMKVASISISQNSANH